MIDKLGRVRIITEPQSTIKCMTAEETFQRKIKLLQNIPDYYDKIILTLDRYTLGNYNGIQVQHVIDWLLGSNVN